MRRILLLAVAVLVSMPFFGQADQIGQINQKPSKENVVRHSAYAKAKAPAEDGEPITVIWGEDFSAGIPATWSNTGTINGSDTALWEYRGPNTTPDITVGSRGSCSSFAPLESATQANGFVIFDSNWYDDPGATCGGASGSGLVPVPHESYLVTDPIDCSGYNDILLEWYQAVRHFSAIPSLEVSADGGATFTRVYDARDFYNPNQGSAFDDFVSLNISSIAGGSNNVVLKFSWQPSGRIAAFDGYYYWMVDDIRLIAKPKNDLVLADYAISSVDFNGPVTVSYGQIPAEQSPAAYALAGLLNQGIYDQSNAGSKFYVYSNSGSFSNLSQLITLSADSFRITGNMIDLSTADMNTEYMYALAAVSDSASDFDPSGVRPSVDSVSPPNVLMITDSVYGVDNGFASREIGSDYADGFGPARDGARFANVMHIKNADTVTAVRIYLGPSTIPGGDVFIEIKDTTPTFGTAFDANLGGDWTNVVLKSEPYRITDADTARGYAEIPIPEVLTGGAVQDRVLMPNMYYVSVSMFSNDGANVITMLDDRVSDQGAFASIYYYYPDGQWYTDGEAVWIRTIFGKSKKQGGGTGINDLEVGNVNIHPNPASSQIQLNVEGKVVSNYQVVITNISGQIVRVMNYSNTNSILENIDVSDLAAGIYSVQVKNELGVSTTKLVIAR